MKNALIFGDSYSTFFGHIPEGFRHYYGGEREGTDFTDVSDTWWYPLMQEASLNLVQNNSWSGSTIGYTGYDGDCSKTSSFIYRLKCLINEGFFTEHRLDTVFVFGGTNDSWSNAPLGKPQFDNFVKQDLFNVLPAIAYFFKTLRETLPQADIYCLVNTDLKPEITATLLEACERYHLTPVTFDTIDKLYNHPTAKGMAQIKNRVLELLHT